MDAHYIPEFHLAQFAGYSFGRLAQYDKQWGKIALRPAARVAFGRNYYQLPKGTLDRTRLETDFARLENYAAPLIRRLGAAGFGAVALSDPERDLLAGYMAILHVRVPAYRDRALADAKRMANDPDALGVSHPTTFRDEARAAGRIESDEELERFRVEFLADIQSGRKRLEIHHAISLMALRPAVEKGKPIMIGRHWSVLRTDEWPGLVMGDQPVTLLRLDQIAPSIGFGTEGVQITMPLSPTSLLIIDDAPREAQLQVIDGSIGLSRRGRTIREPWWATANKLAWLSSKRYVYAQRVSHIQAAAVLLPKDLRRKLLPEG